MANNLDRAKQFMPFSPLKGYYEMAQYQEYIKEDRHELSESEEQILSEKLSCLKKGVVIKLTYYNEDHYETIVGCVTMIDCILRKIKIIKQEIFFDDILSIENNDD